MAEHTTDQVLQAGPIEIPHALREFIDPLATISLAGKGRAVTERCLELAVLLGYQTGISKTVRDATYAELTRDPTFRPWRW